MSLRQIAESTKIGMRFLEAIEAEEFDQLPGGVFAVNYLKQYAAAAGIEAGTLLGHYRRAVGLDPEMPPMASDRGSRLLRAWTNFSLF